MALIARNQPNTGYFCANAKMQAPIAPCFLRKNLWHEPRRTGNTEEIQAAKVHIQLPLILGKLKHQPRRTKFFNELASDKLQTRAHGFRWEMARPRFGLGLCVEFKSDFALARRTRCAKESCQ